VGLPSRWRSAIHNPCLSRQCRPTEDREISKHQITRGGISAVFFPLDTDRFRLGYLYDLSWGGTAASINQSIFPRIQGAAPGAKVQLDGDKYYPFAGFKPATTLPPQKVLNPGG